MLFVNGKTLQFCLSCCLQGYQKRAAGGGQIQQPNRDEADPALTTVASLTMHYQWTHAHKIPVFTTYAHVYNVEQTIQHKLTCNTYTKTAQVASSYFPLLLRRMETSTSEYIHMYV